MDNFVVSLTYEELLRHCLGRLINEAREDGQGITALDSVLKDSIVSKLIEKKMIQGLERFDSIAVEEKVFDEMFTQLSKKAFGKNTKLGEVAFSTTVYAKEMEHFLESYEVAYENRN